METDHFKKSFAELAAFYGIDGNVLFAVVLACAVRGMGNWNGARVMQVIDLLKQGINSGKIVEDLLMQRFGCGLN